MSPDGELKNRSLMVASSGGGGHISAIQGVLKVLKQDPSYEIPVHTPKIFDASSQPSLSQAMISYGASLMNSRFVGPLVQATLKKTVLPILPKLKDIEREIQALSDKEANLNGQREYIDMLLDVYPAGYESAAVWNVLQQQDKIKELRKLVALQSQSDADNYGIVKNYFFELLKKAALDGTPYTEIISTQAMSLPGLCDAVIDYNNWSQTQPNSFPTVRIKQYLTDLATPGAVHFFGPLSRLTSEQQAQIELYGIGCTLEILEDVFHQESHFAKVENIIPSENPMVRTGFKDSSLDHSQEFHKSVSLPIKTPSGMTEQKIEASEKIGCIMLGSQASNDTTEYIETLIHNGCTRVFVFGGTNPRISKRIDDLVAKNPALANAIIRLGNQDDPQISGIMSRSNIVVIRGGGLSVMEQLALNHSSQQTVLVHHANSPSKILSSGISWEDANVDYMIDDLTERQVFCNKTSPNLAARHLRESQLVEHIRLHIYPNESQNTAFFLNLKKFAKNLTDEKLQKYCDDTHKPNKSELSHDINVDFYQRYKKAESHAKAMIRSSYKKLVGIEKMVAEDLEAYMLENFSSHSTDSFKTLSCLDKLAYLANKNLPIRSRFAKKIQIYLDVQEKIAIIAGAPSTQSALTTSQQLAISARKRQARKGSRYIMLNILQKIGRWIAKKASYIKGYSIPIAKVHQYQHVAMLSGPTEPLLLTSGTRVSAKLAEKSSRTSANKRQVQ